MQRKLHIRLQRSNLPGEKRQWFAHTARDKVLYIADVADTLKSHGLSTVDYNAFINNVKQYFDAMASLLNEGFTINTGYFTIQPAVKGSFNSPGDAFDLKRHTVSFLFQPLAPLRRIAERAKVVIERGKKIQAEIAQFLDIDSNTTGKRLTPGGIFIAKGHCIKVAGNAPDCGVWFVSKTNPEKRCKVKKALAGNTAGTVTGIVPPLPVGRYTVEIVTRYTASGVLLKNPRTATGGFTLTVGGS